LVTWIDDGLGGALSVILGIAFAIYAISKLTAKEGLMASMKGYAMDLRSYILKKKSAIMEKFSKGGSKSGGIAGKLTGNDTKSPKTRGNPFKFMEKIKPMDLIKGAAAMLIVAAALFVTAKALQEFGSVSWSSLAKAGVALLGLVLVVAALGMIMSGPVGLMILVGAAAMLILAASLLVLGFAIQAIGTGFGMLAEGLTSFSPLLSTLVPLASGIFVLAGAFGMLGMGMGLLAIGALALLPALPVLMALGSIGMLGMALAGGGEESVTETDMVSSGGGEESVTQAESTTNTTDMTDTNVKLDGVISAVTALEASNKQLLTSLTGKVKGLAEA